MARYDDTPMDFADATLVALAEEFLRARRPTWHRADSNRAALSLAKRIRRTMRAHMDCPFAHFEG